MASAPVVVGVDLSRGSSEALTWALGEARVRATELVLVHAADAADEEVAASSVTTAPTGSGVESAVRAVLGVHRSLAARLDPDVEVRTVAADEPAVEALIEASRHASVLVLGTRGAADYAASALGSVAQRAVVHAHCPVVVVGHHAHRRSQDRVLVGVADTLAGHRAIEFAADEAARRGAVLVLVHAGSPEGGDDGSAGEQLAAAAARAAQRHDTLQVELLTAQDDAAAALAAASPEADLVVVGCHHSTDPFAVRMGDVPSALLPHAQCPVALV